MIHSRVLWMLRPVERSHHGVGAPADRPHHLLDLLLDRGGHRRVADIGVDLGQEVAPDRHRLELAMIDVAGNDGASARHLAAHEFGRDEERHAGAEALAVGLRGFRAFEHLLAAEVLALGHVDHLLGDDAGTREFELGHLVAWKPAQRLGCVGEIAGEVLAGRVSVVHRLDRAAFIFLDPAALAHPFDAGAGEPLLHIDGDVRIRERAGGIVDQQPAVHWRLRRAGFRVAEPADQALLRGAHRSCASRIAGRS